MARVRARARACARAHELRGVLIAHTARGECGLRSRWLRLTSSLRTRSEKRAPNPKEIAITGMSEWANVMHA